QDRGIEQAVPHHVDGNRQRPVSSNFHCSTCYFSEGKLSLCLGLDTVASQFSGFHDAGIASAAAQVASQFGTDLSRRSATVAPDQVAYRDHHARRAKAALQAMRLGKTVADDMHL